MFCEPLNPPGTPLPPLHWIPQEEPQNALEPQTIHHFLLPADAACAGGKQTLHNFDCISVSYAQKGSKQAAAATKPGDSNRKFRLFPFVYLCAVP